MYLRVQWWEMLGHKIDLTKPHDAAKNVNGVLMVDAKALYDAAKNGEIQSAGLNLKEKYTALELMAIVEHMEQQGTELRWCNSDQQLADGLTKASAQERLNSEVPDVGTDVKCGPWPTTRASLRQRRSGSSTRCAARLRRSSAM